MSVFKRNQTFLLAFLCAVFFGAIAFVQASRVAYFQADGKAEVVFDRETHTSPPPSIFAVVFDDESDTPTVVELIQPDFVSPARLEPPEIYNDPHGNLVNDDPRFSAGGVGYGFSGNGYYAVLTLYPSPQIEGWRKYIYTYEVRDSNLIPVSITRTRTFNDFAGINIIPITSFWIAIGVLCGIGVSKSLDARSGTTA